MYENNNRNSAEYDNSRVEVVSSGKKYVGVAYNPTVTIICNTGEFILQTIATSVKTKYEILWDGDVLNTYPSLKIAETFFMDFAGLTKAKYAKLKTATAKG